MNDLLLVIDMQNVYLPDQPWACETAARTKENILKLLENHPKDQTIFTRYIAAEHPVGTWKTYNELNRKINENPWMNELMDGIKEAAESYPVYDKSTYSSFQVPAIRKAAQKADRVILTGEAARPDLNALYARFAPRVFSLTFRDETTPKRDLWAGAGEDTLRGLALGKLQADYDNAPDDAARRTAALAARMLRAAIEGRDEA